MTTFRKAGLALIAFFILKNHRDLAFLMAFMLNERQHIKDLSSSPAHDFFGSPNISSLEKHMNTFADADGFITKQSVFEACVKKWHLPEDKANTLAEITMHMAWSTGVPGVTWSPFGVTGKFLPKDGVSSLTHPYDTGFYHKSHGSVDVDRFEELKKYAVLDANGKLSITQSGLTNYLNHWYKVDNRWHDSPWFYKLIGSAGNKGEYEIIFNRLSNDRIWNAETNSDEKSVTLDTLKSFLIDSAPEIKKIETGILPKSKAPAAPEKTSEASKQLPDLLDKMLYVAVNYARGVVEAGANHCSSAIPTLDAFTRYANRPAPSVTAVGMFSATGRGDYAITSTSNLHTHQMQVEPVHLYVNSTCVPFK